VDLSVPFRSRRSEEGLGSLLGILPSVALGHNTLCRFRGGGGRRCRHGRIVARAREPRHIQLRDIQTALVQTADHEDREQDHSVCMY